MASILSRLQCVNLFHGRQWLDNNDIEMYTERIKINFVIEIWAFIYTINYNEANCD